MNSLCIIAFLVAAVAAGFPGNGEYKIQNRWGCAAQHRLCGQYLHRGTDRDSYENSYLTTSGTTYKLEKKAGTDNVYSIYSSNYRAGYLQPEDAYTTEWAIVGKDKHYWKLTESTAEADTFLISSMKGCDANGNGADWPCGRNLHVQKALGGMGAFGIGDWYLRVENGQDDKMNFKFIRA